MARPGGLEPPAFWSVAKRSIQLGYGRPKKVAEREGFGPSMELLVPYPLSRRAPSASRTPLRISGGRGRIRTHGRVNVNGFQDRRLRPLGHSSTINLDVQRTKRNNDCHFLLKVNKIFHFFYFCRFFTFLCEMQLLMITKMCIRYKKFAIYSFLFKIFGIFFAEHSAVVGFRKRGDNGRIKKRDKKSDNFVIGT